MEDYFVQRFWLVSPPPLPPLFLSPLLVVADTLGKQFVSHLIAFEKLKSRDHNGAGLWDEDCGDTDTIRPPLFGDPWSAVQWSGLCCHNNACPRPSEKTPRSWCASLSAQGHLLYFSPILLLLLHQDSVWFWLSFSSAYKHKHSSRFEVHECVCAFFLELHIRPVSICSRRVTSVCRQNRCRNSCTASRMHADAENGWGQSSWQACQPSVILCSEL